MSEINWEVAADGTAEMLVTCEDAVYWAKPGYFWHNSGAHWVKMDHGFLFTTIATRPTEQKKTVADAYEWVKGRRWVDGYAGICVDGDGDLSFYVKGSLVYSNDSDVYKKVCTREQFEAYAKEQECKQEGERWTHVLYGDKAYIKFSEPDCDGYIIATTESAGYQLCRPHELKPIKPKLTKAEAWDKLESLKRGGISYAYGKVTEEYDII